MTRTEYLKSKGYKQFEDSLIFIKYYCGEQGCINLTREKWYIDIDEDVLDIDETFLEVLNEFAKILSNDYEECMKLED